MSGKKIKNMRKAAETRIAEMSKKIGTLLGIVKDIENNIDLEREKWFEVQKSCKHKFPNQKFRSYMGRGTCFYCGYNDY